MERNRMKRNGTEWNGMNRNRNCFTSERNRTERNGTEWNGTNRNRNCYETERNETERIQRNGTERKVTK